ncbi:MAG: hypothetical protein WBI53_04360, partial [Paludibacter sp.]
NSVRKKTQSFLSSTKLTVVSYQFRYNYKSTIVEDSSKLQTMALYGRYRLVLQRLQYFSGNAFQALIPFKLYSLAEGENYISFLGATGLPVIKDHFFQYMTKNQKESVCRRQVPFGLIVCYA